jgi:glucosylceramidase
MATGSILNGRCYLRISGYSPPLHIMNRFLLLSALAWVSFIHPSPDGLPNRDHALRVRVFSTAENTTWRITLTDTLSLVDFGQPLETQPCVFVDPAKMFQTFVGIGGALTDASAEVFAKLPKDTQEAFLQSYFSREKGIGYSLARTNIHSCDFSSESYTYVREQDTALSSFSVAHDEQYRLPFIRKAIAAAGGKLTLFASPWSPPAWMKDNNDMLHGGKLLAKYDQAWANYYVKFIQSYQRRGIPIWGISVQNEPMAKQTWESCIYSAEEERDFIKRYLGPTMARAGYGHVKIIAWDHNRDLIYQRASTILADPEAAKYVWGIGFHWYETWTGGGNIFDNVQRVEEAFPHTHLIFTEGCADQFNSDHIQDWKWGEAYGRNMIHDFNDGTTGWIDWNVLLDEHGGPNHVQNFCFAPVHANTQNGSLEYMSSFYYIGHFSKFIRPGARRIISSSSRGQLLTTGFRNPDGSLVVVVMNQSAEKVSYRLWIRGKAAEIASLPHSIQTLVLD